MFSLIGQGPYMAKPRTEPAASVFRVKRVTNNYIRKSNGVGDIVADVIMRFMLSAILLLMTYALPIAYPIYKRLPSARLVASQNDRP